MQQPTHITIIGAGPVGAMTAIFLARRGYQVSIYESRPDMRTNVITAGRSINLALANRGIYPLQQLGLMGLVEPLLIPMHGRMIHDLAGNLQFQRYGQKPHEVIYSVSRRDLNIVLMDQAEATGKVTIHFNQAIESVDFSAKTLTVHNKLNDQSDVCDYQLLIGADGSNSVVRQAMHQQMPKTANSYNRTEPLDHGYKELSIPAGPNQQYQMDKNALHIWPRGEYMLIALANIDGSFTVTLFLPNQGPNSFAELKDSAKASAFFNQQFADALALMPAFADEFSNNPTGHLATVRCEPWHFADNTLLIGDAAHGIVPFHGQGMNCGFEDASELNLILDQYNDDWSKVFSAFNQARKPNADAIADLALDNYIEMRKSVAEPNYQLKKALSFELEKRHPERFIPRYSMVMFHRLPYAQAQSRGEIQSQILSQLTDDIKTLEDVDFQLAEQLISERL